MTALLFMGCLALAGVVQDDAGPSAPWLSGRVCDRRSRRALAGARVWIVRSRPFEWRIDEREPSLAETTTDAEGRFEFVGAPLAAVVDVGIEAEGHRTVAAVELPIGATAELVADRATTWIGVVRDLDHRPVAGARVRARAGAGAIRVARETVTDADGAFRLDTVPEDSGLNPLWFALVDVVADGFAEAHPYVERPIGAAPPAERRVEFFLGRGECIEGRVVDAADGAPIPGAHVVDLGGWGAFAQVDGTGAIAGQPPGRRTFQTVTDGRGEFRLDHVPLSDDCEGWGGAAALDLPHRILFFAPGFVASFSEVATLADGASHRIDASLQRAGRLRVVMDRESGPVPADARVVIVPGDPVDPRLLELRGDVAPFHRALPQQGIVEIDGLPVGACSVHLECGFDGASNSGGEPWWRSQGNAVAVVAGATTVIDRLDLPATTAVRVRVVDELGAPVPGTQVTIRDTTPDYFGGSCDANGEQVIRVPTERIASRTELSLIVQPHGLPRPFATASRSEPRGDFVATIRCERPWRLRGRLVRGDGRPEASAFVRVIDGRIAIDEALARSRGERGEHARDAVFLAGARVFEDGTFESLPLPRVPCHVVAHRANRFVDQGAAGDVVIADVLPDRTLEIRFPSDGKEPAPPSGAFEPQPLFEIDLTNAATGEPIPRVAWLRLDVGDARVHDAHFQAVAPGRFRASLTLASLEERRLLRQTRGRLVGFVHGMQLLRLEGIALDAGREPLPRHERALKPARTIEFLQSRSTEGRGWATGLRLERARDLRIVQQIEEDVAVDVPPGTYRLSGRFEALHGEEGGWVASSLITVGDESAPSHRLVEWTPVRAGDLTVRWGEGFTPAPGARFELRSRRAGVSIALDGIPADGWTRSLAPGEWALSFGLPDGSVHEETVLVDAARGATVVLRAR